MSISYTTVVNGRQYWIEDTEKHMVRQAPPKLLRNQALKERADVDSMP
jgi:hypothetical protein